MKAPAFTTRAEAADPPKHLVETFAAALYEATKTPAFPKWADISTGYQDDLRKGVVAAIRAAEAAGYRVVGDC